MSTKNANNENDLVGELPNIDAKSEEVDSQSAMQIKPLTELAIEASQIISRLEQVQIQDASRANNAAPIATLPKEVATATNVFLGVERRLTADILHSMHNLVQSADDSGELMTTLPILDEASRLAVTSHSLAAYISCLDRGLVQKLSARFTADTTRWLNQIFNYTDVPAFYHYDQLEGLVRVTRMMLHYKYPRYVDDGATIFAAKQPTLYSSIVSPLGVVQHLCRQLGLPLACVRPVPVNTSSDLVNYVMDVNALQQMLADDVAQGRQPLIVLADCGTPITGHVDNIKRLQEICRSHDVWLHLRGHNLAALALPQRTPVTSVQNGNIISSIADSFTLSLGSWLGIPALPFVTMYRMWDASSIISNSSASRNKQVGSTRESTLPLIAGLNNDHASGRIVVLPLWMALQSLGKEGMISRFRNNFLSTERICTALKSYRQVRILSQISDGDSGGRNVSELAAQAVSAELLFKITSTSVVFQFIPDEENQSSLQTVPPYYDKLNSWLGQILQIEAPQLQIDICELENVGIVLRYSPFESNICSQLNEADIESFIEYLEQQLTILRATVQHRETFTKLANESNVLEIVSLPEWAGLGGVRYKPEGWESLLNDAAQNELNNLNIALVEALRVTDSAFSLGESNDGMMCVRFGMLTPQSDVDELLGLVVRVGQSVEETSRVLDSMSEIVKKGIETATLDLQKENEDRIWQEGILRNVPVVGSLVNWWSPKAKESGVRGRSLNLTQGVVESTENIYKYHMQLQSGLSTGTRQPPTPQIQTPVGGTSHSRSSSHASSQGGIPANNTITTSTPVDTSSTVSAVTAIPTNVIDSSKLNGMNTTA